MLSDIYFSTSNQSQDLCALKIGALFLHWKARHGDLIHCVCRKLQWQNQKKNRDIGIFRLLLLLAQNTAAQPAVLYGPDFLKGCWLFPAAGVVGAHPVPKPDLFLCLESRVLHIKTLPQLSVS